MLVGYNDGVPTLKILDFGAMSFKKKKRSKNQHKPKKPKIFKIRPNIGIGDLKNKAKSAANNLSKGHVVIIDVVLKGRENHYIDLGIDALTSFKDEIKEFGNFNMDDKIDGNKISCKIYI